MNKILKRSLDITKSQWQLLVITCIISVIFQMDYGIGDENFGLILLVAIPYFFGLIFNFMLTKLIDHQKSDPKSKLTELLKIYTTTAPKLILPMLGLMAITALVMFVIITLVYGLFSLLGISNAHSIFESSPKDLNYLIFYLVFSIAITFFSFQGVLYFLKKQPFFAALINSVKLAKEHLPFTIAVGVCYFMITVISGFIGFDSWYKNLIIGIISGLQGFYLSVLYIVYYEEKIE